MHTITITYIHIYNLHAVLCFSFLTQRLGSFRMEIFAPWKASVTISEFEASEGSWEASRCEQQVTRSKALQAPCPSGGGCNRERLNSKRNTSKHIKTRETRQLQHIQNHVKTERLWKSESAENLLRVPRCHNLRSLALIWPGDGLYSMTQDAVVPISERICPSFFSTSRCEKKMEKGENSMCGGSWYILVS